jgi:hypothetical protein
MISGKMKWSSNKIEAPHKHNTYADTIHRRRKRRNPNSNKNIYDNTIKEGPT